MENEIEVKDKFGRQLKEGDMILFTELDRFAIRHGIIEEIRYETERLKILTNPYRSWRNNGIPEHIWKQFYSDGSSAFILLTKEAATILLPPNDQILNLYLD